jgi:20S proteasome alpha/beta subunit
MLLIIEILPSNAGVLGCVTFFGTLLRRRTSNPSSIDSDSSTVTFDRFGGLGAVEDAYELIKRASPIAILRSNNSTIVAFATTDPDALQVPMVLPLNKLSNHPSLYLLITGISGDCRAVIRFAKETVLNNTVSFVSSPRGYIIAKSIADYMQSSTQGTSRPLACHTFIIDTANGELFQVNAAGILSEVIGGAAGRNMVDGIQILEQHLLAREQNVTKDSEAIVVDAMDKMISLYNIKSDDGNLSSIGDFSKRASKAVLRLLDQPINSRT